VARMHADEIEIDGPLVERLVAAQFPQWAGLPVRRVPSAGTDNAMFRLGEDMAVRLPRLAAVAHQVEKEQRWLPRLAPGLPLPVPAPLGTGEPGEGFPLPWSVYGWLEGENPGAGVELDLRDAAVALGRFVAAMREVGVDAAEGPPSFRGRPVSERDADVRTAIATLGAAGVVDAAAATTAWDEVLTAPAWDGPPVWTHGDLLPGNLLVHRGRLSAVIDFGGLGVGDPACDLIPAWALLTADTRELFREVSGADDATWARARGWALSIGLLAVDYYRVTNPVFAGVAQRAIDEVLAETARVG